MMFLLRTAFWLCVVIMILPTGKSQDNSNGPEFGAAEAMSVAGAAVDDMWGFCSRKPEACAVGSQALTAFGHKAQASAKFIYEFLSDKLGPSETGSVAESEKPAAQPASVQPSQNTLTPSDMGPAWRGPAPRREAQAKRPA